MDTITIRTRNHGTADIEGTIVPGTGDRFAVHRRLRHDGEGQVARGEWDITHIPTGMRANLDPYRVKAEARDVASWIAGLANWDALDTDSPDPVGTFGRDTVDRIRTAVEYGPDAQVAADQGRTQYVPVLPEGWAWDDPSFPLDSSLEAPDGCVIEVDGVCPHGHEAPSLV